MPIRIQRKRTKGWRMPEGAVYVGRPGKFGNPFKVDAAEGIGREQAMDSFIGCAVHRRSGPWQKYPTADVIRAELKGKDLACFCPLDQPCHADVLLELANS